jgi:hypothetical protein
MNNPINFLRITRISPAERVRIESIDPRIRVIDAGGWFDGEIPERNRT